MTGGLAGTAATSSTTETEAAATTSANESTSAATSSSATATPDTTDDTSFDEGTTEPECQERKFHTHTCKPFPADCPEPPPWRPTRCGDVVCADGEVCVEEEQLVCCAFEQPLSSTDDASTGDTTAGGDSTTGSDRGTRECVGLELCSSSLFPQYSDGHLFCPVNHGCY